MDIPYLLLKSNGYETRKVPESRNYLSWSAVKAALEDQQEQRRASDGTACLDGPNRGGSKRHRCKPCIKGARIPVSVIASFLLLISSFVILFSQRLNKIYRG